MTESRTATTTDILEANAIVAGIAMYQSLAIVAALAEARMVDQFKVAAWAETMAGIATAKNGNPDGGAAIAEQLRGFAGVIRSMATKPAGGGQVRQ